MKLRPALTLLLALALLGSGCGTSAGARPPRGSAAADCPTEPTPSEAAGPDATRDASGVIDTTMVFVDRERATPGIPGRRAMACRILPTEIRVPTTSKAPRPLIVVAHGLDGDPRSLAALLDAWADAGYVVAAPKFPTTKKDADGNSLRSESADQARDLSFVVGALIDRSRASSGLLAGRIDPRRVGAAGMSLGGLAVYGLVSNTCCRDRRIGAAILMAAVRRQFPDDEYEPNRAPVFLVQGDADVGYHNSADAYPELSPPKWFVTLHGSTHAPPFEVPPGPEAPAVYAMTTAFWDRYLKSDRHADGRIEAVVRKSRGRFTLQRDFGP